jgi:hypothetical protein
MIFLSVSKSSRQMASAALCALVAALAARFALKSAKKPMGKE